MGRPRKAKQEAAPVPTQAPEKPKEQSPFFDFDAKPIPLKEVFPTVPVQESPPPMNIVVVEGGNIDVPLSKIMAENREVCCPICGKPLPSEERNVKTVVMDGSRWMACKGCFLPAK